MIPRRPSKTAILTAIARAMHRDEPPPWILDDALSGELAGEEGAAMAERLRRELPAAAVLSFTRWVCVRARVPEDLVTRATAGGLDQYVILGAGLDTFAYRRPDLREKVHAFEVDQPASQAWKRRRLQELDVPLPANLTFVPVDFERESLHDGLRAAGFDWTRRAVFSWLGVTMYLTLDAIRTTLGTIASSAPGSQVVFTYNVPSDELRGLAGPIEGAVRAIANESGEPFLSLFRPAEIEQLVVDLGFTEVTHFGPEEAQRTYFPGRDDVRFGGAQRIIVASVPA